jgi:hypothetical protein
VKAWFQNARDEPWHEGTWYGACDVAVDHRIARTALADKPPGNRCRECVTAGVDRQIAVVDREIDELAQERVALIRDRDALVASLEDERYDHPRLGVMSLKGVGGSDD